MIRKRLDRQAFAYGAAQRIDASDLGGQQCIRRKLAADSQRIDGIEFAVEIGVREQSPLVNRTCW
jgi:hypothetical protein